MTLQEKYEKQKEINKELVDENEALKFAARMSEKTEKQLRAEIEEFKETNHELAELAIARNKQNFKAKEIIKSLIALHYNPTVNKDDLKKQDKILEQAEQFLKDSEVKK